MTKKHIMNNKPTFFLVFFLMSLSAFCQIESRKYIEGKVNVPANDDAKNISIYNKTLQQGTITNRFGKFKIFAAVNDTLSISSIQYDDFEVIVDKEVYNNKTMTIFLKESVSVLDEVVVRPYDLSGDLATDIQSIEVIMAEPIITSSKNIVYGYTGGPYDAPNSQSTIRQSLMDQSYLRYGLDFADLFQRYVLEKDKNKSNKKLNDKTLRDIYSNQFYTTYLKIPESRVNQFVTFAQNNGLTDQMLKDGNEMDLIQFLIDQSRAFKKDN